MKTVILARAYEQQDLTLRCPLCDLVRKYGTQKGLRQGLAEHMLDAHRIQIIFGAKPGELRTKLSELRDAHRLELAKAREGAA